MKFKGKSMNIIYKLVKSHKFKSSDIGLENVSPN